ncbi:MAG: ABC transporter permease [Chloroflexi bacterium]|nr:ABC transporter permease [Chloroflexota bacterium]MCL5274125.1 ABC transporter permease [Chloroflexota bacterium]
MITRSIASFAAIFIIAARRLWSARWLALASIVGLVAVVALALSVPLYADAVYHRVLLTNIADAQIDQQGIRRPPFTFMFRYAGKYDGAIDWPNIAASDQYLAKQAPGALGLPRKLLVRYFETQLGQLFPITDAAYLGKHEPLIWTSLAAISDLKDHIQVVDGRMPEPSAAGDPVVEVMVSMAMAEKLGIQAGEQFIHFLKPIGKGDPTQLRVRVAGIWIPTDPAEPYWFSHPESLDETLLTTESVYSESLAPRFSGEVFLAVWYMVFDGTSVRADQVPGLLERIRQVNLRASTLLPRLKLDVSPVEALVDYQATSRLLSIQLLAISVPSLLLMFAYTLLVASLTVVGRHNEIAVLRSRGATVPQILGIALLESVVVGFFAIIIGSLIAQALADLVGQTRSFLNFSGGAMSGAPFQVVVTRTSIEVALAVATAAVLLTLFPTWSVANNTVVTYKQERARALKPPWWQRAWVDLLLLIPAAYGTYLLQKQGAIVLPSSIGTGAEAPADPFANPLLFIVPVLGILAMTLILIRLFPHFLRVVAWLLARFKGAALVMAARQLARSPSLYAAPMLLLVLTLGLGTFTASLAVTLDQHLVNEVHYAVGGDMRIDELGESTRDTGLSNVLINGGVPQENASSGATKPPSGPLYMFLPIEDHLKISGVQAAARIGSYPAEAQYSSRNASARFMGIDRLDFSNVAYWRSDFAAQPLGSLMNLLAVRYDGVLVPETVLQENGLNVGDRIRLVVALSDGAVPMDVTIVGTFRLWPGWNPRNKDTRPLFVGNLDYFFDQAGGQVPYEVWLKVSPTSNPVDIIEGVRKLGVVVMGYAHVQSMVDAEQMRPARQGLFGMLSVGFGAAGLFTVLGFFLYSVFSLRRRTIELGVLRAIGFSNGQMAVFLGCELALLLGVGMAAGTLLGVIASRMYIPYFQISATEEGLALPFAVVVAWPEIYRIYATFGGLFIIALIALLFLLRRMRIFEAVKMGESV